jgi:hypothetical protein
MAIISLLFMYAKVVNKPQSHKKCSLTYFSGDQVRPEYH